MLSEKGRNTLAKAICSGGLITILGDGKGKGAKFIIRYPPAPWRAPEHRIVWREDTINPRKTVTYRPRNSPAYDFMKIVIPVLRTMRTELMEMIYGSGGGNYGSTKDYRKGIPLSLTAVFLVPCPKNKMKKGGGDGEPISRPDLTNYTKLLEDTLVQAGVIPDDSVIVEHHTRKAYERKGGAGSILVRLCRLEKEWGMGMIDL